MAEFDRLSEEYKFEVIEASADAEQVFEHLKAGIFRALESDSRKEYISARSARTLSISDLTANEKAIPTAHTANVAKFESVLRSIMAHSADGNGRTAHRQK
jgi:hypothetical protein